MATGPIGATIRGYDWPPRFPHLLPDNSLAIEMGFGHHFRGEPISLESLTAYKCQQPRASSRVDLAVTR